MLLSPPAMGRSIPKLVEEVATAYCWDLREAAGNLRANMFIYCVDDKDKKRGPQLSSLRRGSVSAAEERIASLLKNPGPMLFW